MKTYLVSAICHKSVEVEAKNLKEATKLGRETIGLMTDSSNVMILEITPLERQILNAVAAQADATVDTVVEALESVKDSVASVTVPVSNDAKVQVLVCGKCEKTWERPAQRGRKPINCPEC